MNGMVIEVGTRAELQLLQCKGLCYKISRLESTPYYVVFADLSNAFDTLTHKTILDKLRVYGLTESSINW